MKQNYRMPSHYRTTIFLICLLVFFFKPVSCNDQVGFLHQYCSENGQYDQGSVYQNNFNLLVSNLSSQAAVKKFYNSTVGEGTNKVYGLYLCIEAYSLQVCQDCITLAAGQIQQKCPYNVEAIIWYGQCMLRYSNRSIFSIEDDSVYFNYENGPLNYKQFNQQLSSMLIDLFRMAIADNSSLAYATELVYVTQDTTLVGYVDCTPDLTPSQCNSCFQTGLDKLQMDGSQFGTLVQPSCRLAYYFTNVGHSQLGKQFYIPVVVFGAVAAASLILNFYLCSRKSKARGKPTGMDDIESMESLQLEFNAIKSSTDNFSAANKIGQGGFGVVYMGALPDGQAIAVKRLASCSGQGIREFKSEACLAAKLQHKNLVKLFGFCVEGEEKLLVYEFVPNKSLDRFLFGTKKDDCLKWETRQKIIMGIARGLLYLHEDSRIKIIHRDLKPSNILLDEEMNPKIADFGMAKLFGVDQTQGNTSRVAGTFGYMAPEYATTGFFSVKSDVYSFGVILLEIVSGRRNRSHDIENQYENLLNQAWRLWKGGASLELLDSNLRENCSISEVERFIHIGLLCIQEDACQRPSIASVLSMLTNQSVVALPPATPPPTFPYSGIMPDFVDHHSNAIFTEEVFTNVHGR